MIAEKEFLTEFGHLTLPRRVFQQDNGGIAHFFAAINESGFQLFPIKETHVKHSNCKQPMIFATENTELHGKI